MDTETTISALAALAQRTRMEAFRVLVRNEPHGLPAGELAKEIDVPQNTLSSHLSVLSQAELVTSSRKGTTITYRANLPRVREVVSFMLRDCCAGKPEICAPLAADLAACCDEACC